MLSDRRYAGPIRANHERRASYGPHSPVIGERGARTRRAIVVAARDAFEANGLYGTSVEDIAAAAGISRAALYQYFESKEELFTELIREAAGDLLRVIRRLGPIGPTPEGYDNLHWWLGEWAWVQDKYKALYLQAAVVASPETTPRALVAEYIVAYVSALMPRLESALRGDDIDIDGVATVLLALLFRVNEYRRQGLTRRLSEDELLDGLATFVQLALFPSTPAHDLSAHTGPARTSAAVRATRRRADPECSAGREQVPKTVQRILDAAAATFAVRGFHATSVRDVLEAAGAGRGTFYRYFDDKTHLLVTLTEHCMVRLEELATHFADAVVPRDDAHALREWLEECLVLHRKYRGVFQALLQEEARHPALEKLRLNSGAAILLAFDGALASIDREYAFDVRVGSMVLLALLERGPDYAFGTPYDLGDERVVEVLATLVERGLLGRAPSGRRPHQDFAPIADHE